MKHLLIEAPDACGKDTLIKNLMPHCQNLIVTHFSFPEGNTDREKRKFQEESFRREFEKSSFFLTSALFSDSSKKMNLIVWNRSHLGEFVYGNLYRQTNPEEWVLNFEDIFQYDKKDDVYLLLLTADPDFLISKDDGLSFAATVDARKREIANFEGAFNMSQIKKKLKLKVDKDGNYLPQSEILNTVINFLKS